jgi:hypothetical protein
VARTAVLREDGDASDVGEFALGLVEEETAGGDGLAVETSEDVDGRGIRRRVDVAAVDLLLEGDALLLHEDAQAHGKRLAQIVHRADRGDLEVGCPRGRACTPRGQARR